MNEHPLRKFYNVIDNGEPHEKLKALPEFPRIVEVEVTNHCNFHCQMCKTGLGTAQRKRGYMSQEHYDKILSDARVQAIKFVGHGEPTLHKQFLDFVKQAKEKGIICHLTTNGSMFDEEYMKEIIASEIDSIKFSFQGVTANGYYAMRRREDFEDLLQKIEKLYQIRGGGTMRSPYITIGTSVLSETKEEISEFKERCEKFCDKVEVGITALDYNISDELIKAYLEPIKGQRPQYRRFRCCHQVFDVITVHWNGNITACCGDNDEQMVLGNLDNASIEACWNSERERLFRSILAEGQYEKLPLCSSCYDIYGWTHQEDTERL